MHLIKKILLLVLASQEALGPKFYHRVANAAVFDVGGRSAPLVLIWLIIRITKIIYIPKVISNSHKEVTF